MALEIADRVKETTTTTSTGTYALAGAVDGFQSFAAVGDGNTTYYACTDGTDYEVGIGSYTASGTTLSRVTILESSNSDAAVNWGAGTKEIFVTVPAEKYLVRDASGNVSLTGNLTISGTVDGRDVSADGSKLDGIESGATADQTAAQIRAKVEAASDSNVFTDADHTKLNGIEAGATGDQTNAEIRAAVEAATDSNVFTDADHAKLNGIEANAKDDQTITAGSGLTGGGTGDVTLSHADTSSQASVNGSGRTYIQDITLDTYGHVTGLATATETVVNTDTVPNNATITITAGNALTGGGNFTTDQASNETITINHQDTSSQASVNNSGRTYIQDITLDGYGHVTGISSATETVTNTNTNQLTTFQVEDGDGTEVTISHGKEWKFVEGTSIDINWTDTSTGSDGDPYDLTISHADTSSLSGTYGSTANGTKIDQITVDAQGHVTGITTGPAGYTTTFQLEDGDGTEVTISHGKEVKFVEGGGIDINWTDTSNGTDGDPYDLTFTHADTSSQGNVDTSGSVIIDSVTLDTYGHVTNIGTRSIDQLRIFDNRAAGDVSPDGLPDKTAYFTFTDDLPNTGNTWDSVINMAGWGNGYRAWQLASNSGNGDGNTGLYFRSGEDSSWGTMQRVFADDYHPNADKWTTARTLSLSGDASGSVSWDGSANATLSVTVANDSHNHDGRYFTETESDARYLRGNANDSASGKITFNGNNTNNWDTIATGTGSLGAIEIFNQGSGNDAFMTFHVGGDFACYFGLDGGINDLAVGGWSMGANSYRIWHAGNDGSGSGLDADKLDGVQGSSYLRSDASDTFTNLSGTSVTLGSGVVLQESTDRADLLQITSSTSTWGGLQIRNSSNEGRWSFMTDGSTAGLYDDENGDWHMQMQENGGVTLYANGTANFTTGTTYMEMARHLDMNNYDIYGCDQIFHHGDTNTYMQFHAADQWRVVVGGTERLEVKNSSPHVLVTGDLNSTSDARLKENVEPIANALSDITQLEGVSFDWKDTGTRGHGFIAQQVEPILPDVVQTDDETGIKSINYVGMIGHLVEAIKEQQTQIDALTAQVEELKRQ